MKKYELTSAVKVINGVVLYQIQALETFGNVKKGDLGGWIESEKNLSQYGNARIGGVATVFANTDYIVFKNWWSSGRYFTWTRSNNKWNVGCFFGTGDELVAKAYRDSEKSGREYERVVKYVNDILKEKEDGTKTE